MKALPLIALSALAAASGAAEDRTPRPPLVSDGLTWRMASPAAETVELRTADGRSRVTVPVAQLTAATGLDARGPTAFALEREAGKTRCTGTRDGAAVAASGTCRFVSHPAFEEGLAQRGVALGTRDNLVALALVDARLALVDALSQEGLPVTEAGDLTAAAALKVTGSYVNDLKAAGLRLDRFGDVLACRAVGVDGSFLRQMGEAGYAQLTAHQAIAMRAVGVTPGYAAAMNRAAGAMRAVEDLGGLQ